MRFLSLGIKLSPQSKPWLTARSAARHLRLKSVNACHWLHKYLNFVIAPAILSAIITLLIYGQPAAAATMVGAWFVLARNISQSAVDFRRRIVESYGNAVKQLASDKLEERLGGIYTLESISQESRDHYWTAIETLCAFLRERTQRNERERTSVNLKERVANRAYFLWEAAGCREGADFTADAEHLERIGEPPPSDIDAALTVINRRSEENRDREEANGWRLDLRDVVLKQAVLIGAHFERAILRDAHLEHAYLAKANFKGASLNRVNFHRAYVSGAHFEDADLRGARLEMVVGLQAERLKGADLNGIHRGGTRISVEMPGGWNPNLVKAAEESLGIRLSG